MKKTLLAIISVLLLMPCAMQAKGFRGADKYVKHIYVGPFDSGHIQGIAVDKKNGYIYCSFTTMLVKIDMQGNVIGSVTGLLGHLGCLTFNEKDGRVYGSLEYKNDEIGKGILEQRKSNKKFPDAWYIAIFDGSKINRMNMDYATSGVMTAVYLPEVVADYEAVVNGNKNRYGCRGIDGVTFGPTLGTHDGRHLLTCAYGVYSDNKRKDNDYQILLQYDTSDWHNYELPLTQDSLHKSGPQQYLGKYFVYTGNTSWGVQNLQFDKYTGNWFMFVYAGHKQQFLNNSLYIVDGNVPAKEEPLKGSPTNETAKVLSLYKDGLYDNVSGTYSWNLTYGTTGFAPLGDGYYYIAHARGMNDRQYAEIYLYQWTGDAPTPLRIVKNKK
jgi:hypothetical protein